MTLRDVPSPHFTDEKTESWAVPNLSTMSRKELLDSTFPLLSRAACAQQVLCTVHRWLYLSGHRDVEFQPPDLSFSRA